MPLSQNEQTTAELSKNLEDYSSLSPLANSIIRLYAGNMIFHLLEEGCTLDEIRDILINDKQTRDELLHGIQILESRIVTPDPNIAKIMQNSIEQLDALFPTISGFAIYLMGSTAHGGAMLRLKSKNKIDDTDWGFICYGDPRMDSMENRKKMFSIVDYELQQSGTRSCSGLNGREKSVITPQSTRELLREIYTTGQRNNLIEKMCVMLQPTYPKSIWETNATTVLEALRILYKANEVNLAMNLAQGMLEIWRWQFHHLKTKHIGIKDEMIRNKKMMNQLATELHFNNAALSLPFLNLLQDAITSDIPIQDLVTRLISD